MWLHACGPMFFGLCNFSLYIVQIEQPVHDRVFDTPSRFRLLSRQSMNKAGVWTAMAAFFE